MLRWFIRRKLDAEEKKLGVSMDYLRHVAQASPTAFLRFASILPFANSRKTLPKEAWYSAQLTALRHEDCGPCLQIGVRLARRDDVPAEVAQALLDERYDALPSDLADVARFTRAVVATVSDDDLGGLRETLRSKYGDRGIIEIAYAIASSRIPPTVKKALGYAESCEATKIHVE